MVPYAEGAVTRLRREFKLLMQQDSLAALIRQLEVSQGSISHPESIVPTLITSVYFDRPHHPLFQRAIATPGDCLKVRTKEYFPDLGRTGDPRVVFELKRERNQMTQKRRLWLSRRELASTFRGKQIALDDSLVAVLAVTYRRRVFQRCEAWRVTVDDQITFRPVTNDEALGEEALAPERLQEGQIDRRVVVEVKHMGNELPAWLVKLEAEKARSFSKFAEGMSRLYGEVRRGEVQGG